MEQSDLVRPGRVTGRRLLVLFALGLVLAGARASRSPAEPERVLVVEIGPDTSLLDEAATVREEVLLAEARRLGWDRSDPIASRHLLRSMRAAGATGDDDTLLEEAFALGLDRTDPVVREWLVGRATRALVDDLAPAPGEIDAFYADHGERFRRPDRVRIAHVFVADADAAFPPLDGVAPEDAAALGDPLLGLRPVDTTTPERVGLWLGAAAEEALVIAPIGAWTPPVPSPYGRHAFHVLEREPGAIPPLDAIEAEVRADWEAAVVPARARERVDALVDAWDVTVVRP